jgi:hypothetical protein
MNIIRRIVKCSLPAMGCAAFFGVASLGASAASPQGLLQTIHKHVILTPTISDGGDANPYAVIVAPVSSGKIQAGDVLVDNFNNVSNLQGTGTTIVDYNPATKSLSVFARLPQQLPQCPGGVGMTAAMTMLKSGWIIVGSTPSVDGSTRTKGPGGLLVLDSRGNLAATWTGPKIDGPWGNVALIDNGTTASLFVSMAGFGVTGPKDIDPKTGYPIVIHQATVLRLDLSIPDGKPPVITSQTVVGDGFGERADKDAFMVGPTGLAMGPGDTLYVSDALSNRIAAISNASKRTDSAGLGQTVTQGGLLRRPLALVFLPNGHLLTCNAQNGQVVEVDPAAGQQLYAQWIDTDAAQSPPGNGDLFGIALTPDGKGFYYVEDDINTLMEAKA